MINCKLQRLEYYDSLRHTVSDDVFHQGFQVLWTDLPVRPCVFRSETKEVAVLTDGQVFNYCIVHVSAGYIISGPLSC